MKLNYKKTIQTSGLTLFLLLSNNLKYINTIAIPGANTDIKTTKEINAKPYDSTSSKTLNHSDYIDYKQMIEFSRTPEQKLEEILTLEPKLSLPKTFDYSLIPLLYNAESLDKYLDSMAEYKKEPKEAAFDDALINVLKKRNLDSTNIDFYLLKASAWQESRFDSTVVSSKGAVSYMQLMEGTYLTSRPGDRFPEDALNPENNISAGIDYYLYLTNYIKNNHPRPDTLTSKNIMDYSIAGYNAGHGAFTFINTPEGIKKKPEEKQWLVKYMPEESRNHVDKVNAKMAEFRNRDEIIAFAQEYRKRKEYLNQKKLF